MFIDLKDLLSLESVTGSQLYHKRSLYYRANEAMAVEDRKGSNFEGSFPSGPYSLVPHPPTPPLPSFKANQQTPNDKFFP